MEKERNLAGACARDPHFASFRAPRIEKCLLMWMRRLRCPASAVQSGGRTRARANVAYLRGGAGRCRFPARTLRTVELSKVARQQHAPALLPHRPPAACPARLLARNHRGAVRTKPRPSARPRWVLRSSSRCEACECALRRAEDRNLADRRLRPRNRCLLSQLRLQPECDEAADGFGSARLIGLFCCPGIHIVPEYGRQSDGSYRVLTGCRTPPFFS